MVGTSELDFILRFLAMAELKRASFCSFGLPKTFVGIALGFAASLVEEPAQGACQPYKPVCHLLQGGTCQFGKHLHVVLDGV